MHMHEPGGHGWGGGRGMGHGSHGHGDGAGGSTSAVRAGRLTVADLPPEVLAAFRDGRPSDGAAEPLIIASSDLAPDGTFGAQFLLADAERVCVVTPNGSRPGVRDWPLRDLSKVEVETLVGQNALVGIVAGNRVELCRFSNSRQREFHRAARALDELVKKGELPKDHHEPDKLQYYCSTCGRLLPEPGSVCPACLNRGQVLMRLARYLAPHWKRAAALIALMVASATIQTLPPYLNKVLLDDILTKKHVTSVAGWDVSALGWSSLTWLAAIVTLFLGSRLVLLGIDILNGRQATWLGPRIVGDLRGGLFHHMQRLSLSYFDRSRTGILLNRVMTDTGRVQGFLVNGVPSIGIDLFTVIIIGAILLTFNWQLTLFILIPLPIVIYVSRHFWHYIRALFGRAWGRRARLQGALNDSLSGIRVIKAFGQEEQEVRRFDEHNWAVLRSETDAEQTWATFFPIITFVSMIGTFLVWYIGGAKVVGGTMTIGTLFAFFGYLGMFYRPIQMIARVNEWVTRDLTAAERIFEVLDTEPEISDAPDAKPLADLRGEVRFEDVVFGYDPLRPVIKGVTIDIQPGEMVGLVGRSGAGKSTIINLLCRFYDPQSGRILIDGIDLKDVRQRDWHHHIGIVPQEPFLFSGSIAENIRYAQPTASRSDIIRAARAANAHGFIMRFPDGYDSEVGERGARLSGGERQRIAIARAILHNPKILILDEATSSVDTETEQQIQEAISRLVKGRTVFAIAHRLSTLKHANRLLVIEDGKVVEFGAHGELVEKNGTYARLVLAQRELSSIHAVGG